MTQVHAHFDFSDVQTVDALNARQTQTESGSSQLFPRESLSLLASTDYC